MNITTIIHLLHKSLKDYEIISKVCVHKYIQKNGIDFTKSKILSAYLLNLDEKSSEKINFDFFDTDDFSLPFLIELFEYLIPYSEKKERGITYTPIDIKKYILETIVKKDDIPYICDPSCGCGSFLITAAEMLYKKYKIPYKMIIEKYLFGADIKENAIKQAIILLSLLALSNGEEEPEHFNFIIGNMLDLATVNKLLKMHRSGYDCVVGNPPYVRSKNIDDETKNYLHMWETAQTGNTDLYIPFFEVGLYLLKKDGFLGYITPNTYIQAINGRALRNLFLKNRYDLKIIDFRDAQIFGSVTNYTCITIIGKENKQETISYCRIKEISDLSNGCFSYYKKDNLKCNVPWRLFSSDIDNIIFKIEHAGIPISNWKIRNGLATLRNDLFFFLPTSEDKKYYYRSYCGKNLKIEKKICIKIAKPNIIKNEKELKANREMAIFPYYFKDGKITVMKEDYISKQFPATYQFLKDNKQLLLDRDKGKGEYEEWYAYGRTQGLNNFGKKLLIPYISGNPIAVLSTDDNLLFYCGYALFSNDITELKLLKIFLESDVFWYYLCHTSKPYSKGYMSFAKNYIKDFAIPKLDSNEINYVLNEHDKKSLNKWIWQRYMS